MTILNPEMLFEQFKNMLSNRRLLFQFSDHPNLVINGVYSGFDPTAKSLHIGNLVPILGLIFAGQQQIQPLALIGSATTLIGDPTGRMLAKPTLSESEIFYNAQSISRQIEKVYYRGMDMTQSKNFKPIKFVDNLTWFKNMNLIDFLTNFGRYIKVNNMLSRNCVQNRLNSDDGLTFCELSYQLMQGFDFLHLHEQFGINVQIGGSDQWGNMISGTEFIRKKFEKDAAFVTLPLLTTANGTKIGKSLGNGVWLDSKLTAVYDFYQYFASLNDEDAKHILPILNIMDSGNFNDIIIQHDLDPSKHYLQKHLAKYMTTLVHDETMSNQAIRLSTVLFSYNNDKVDFCGIDFDRLLDSSRLKVLSRSKIGLKEITLFDFLKLVFPENSNNQTRNMIRSGGIRVNHEKMEDLNHYLSKDALKDHVLVNFGKTSFFIVKIESD